jgi:hypothetical protein
VRASGVSISFARAAGIGRAKRFVSSLPDDVKYEKGEEVASLYFNALWKFFRSVRRLLFEPWCLLCGKFYTDAPA